MNNTIKNTGLIALGTAVGLGASVTGAPAPVEVSRVVDDGITPRERVSIEVTLQREETVEVNLGQLQEQRADAVRNRANCIAEFDARIERIDAILAEVEPEVQKLPERVRPEPEPIPEDDLSPIEPAPDRTRLTP